MESRKTIAIMGFVLAVLVQGCAVWQHESHLDGVSEAGVPQTRSKYWIRIVAHDTLSSPSTWEKCLSIYERQMPSVFSPDGRPVFVELETVQYSGQNVGAALLNNLVAICTVCVLPMCDVDFQSRSNIHVSLDERQKDVKTFAVETSMRRWTGLLAPAWPMPTVVDQRFVHARKDGGFCRQEYAEAFGEDLGTATLHESWNGEADAIVHGVARMLLQFEEDQRRANKSRQIGD